MSERQDADLQRLLDLAYEAAEQSVEEAVRLWQTISVWNYPGSENDEVRRRNAAVVARRFASLWAKLPEYRTRVRVVSIEVVKWGSGSVEGWTSIRYENALAACVGMADSLCDWIADRALTDRPDLVPGEGMTFEVTEEVVGLFADRHEQIATFTSGTSHPRSVGDALLARARLEWDVAKSNAAMQVATQTGDSQGGATAVDPLNTQDATSITDEPGQGVGETAERQPDSDTWTFARDGDGYYISAIGVEGHFGRLKGFDYLAKLIDRAGKDVLMVELVRDEDDDGVADRRRQHRFLDAGDWADMGEAGGGVMREGFRKGEAPVDKRAVEEIRERLKEIAEELEEARDNNDRGLVSRLQEEQEKLKKHVLGQYRKDDPEVNKLRSRISGALKVAYEHLNTAQPPMRALANHFAVFISAAGATFSYRPEPAPCWSRHLPGRIG
jgi:hypothetical protein